MRRRATHKSGFLWTALVAAMLAASIAALPSGIAATGETPAPVEQQVVLDAEAPQQESADATTPESTEAPAAQATEPDASEQPAAPEATSEAPATVPNEPVAPATEPAEPADAAAIEEAEALAAPGETVLEVQAGEEEDLVTVETHVDLYQEGWIPHSTEEATLNIQASGSDTAGARSALNTAFEDVATKVDLRSFNISKDDISDLIKSVINSNPDLFYVSSGVRYTYGSKSGTVYEVTCAYYYSTSSISSMKTRYHNALNAALSWVPQGATDFQKAKAVHDWLVLNCTYNHAAADAGYESYGDRSPWNAYGAFVNKKCVCQGYALAFLAAMDTLGIKCDYVTQYYGSSGHGWNRVRLYDSATGAYCWFNLDATFDDWDDGVVRTTYFVKSDAWFRKNPAKGGSGNDWHTTWSPAGTAGTNTRYDSTTNWPVYTSPASVGTLSSFTLSQTSMTLGTYSSATLTITPSPTSYPTYGATWKSSDESVATVDGTGKISTCGKNGTTTITCTLGGLSRTCKVTVSARDLSHATVTVADQQYTGSAIQPTPKVEYNGLTLERNVDYTISGYANNTNIGMATITIRGKETTPAPRPSCSTSCSAACPQPRFRPSTGRPTTARRARRPRR